MIGMSMISQQVLVLLLAITVIMGTAMIILMLVIMIVPATARPDRSESGFPKLAEGANLMP